MLQPKPFCWTNSLFPMANCHSTWGLRYHQFSMSTLKSIFSFHAVSSVSFVSANALIAHSVVTTGAWGVLYSHAFPSPLPPRIQAPWLSHLYSCSPLFCLNYCNGMVQETHSLCGNSLPPLLGAQNTFPFIFISLQGGYVTSPSPALASCAPSGLDPGHLGWELFAYIAVSRETRNFTGARRTFCWSSQVEVSSHVLNTCCRWQMNGQRWRLLKE